MDLYQIFLKALNHEIFNNTLSQIITAIVIYFIIFLLLKKIIRWIINWIQKYIDGKEINFGILLLDIIKNTPKYFFLALEVYVPLKVLTLPDITDKVVNGLFAFVLILQVIRILNRILIYSISKNVKGKWKIGKTSQNAFQLIIKIVVWIVGGLLLLSNLGIEITPLIASLGIWGIAVAFALQSMLQDLFSSLSILFSRPFNVGDYIVLNENVDGTVTDITLKATHIKTIQGYEIRIPNKDVLNNPIKNYGKMKTRRTRIEIGVTYETPIKKLKNIEKIIEKIITKIDDLDYERTRLIDLADFSIIFKISYVVRNKNYQIYLQKKEKVLLGILEAFEKKGIEIAYPTQVVYTSPKKS